MSDESGPAFPTAAYDRQGLTLRDYFAARVLTGMAANQAYLRALREHYGGDPEADSERAAEAARECYRIADAMLRARQAKGPDEP